MEPDRHHHYFFDEVDREEDFFKSLAPSEDIWKKFQLLPTPPMSPTGMLEGATGDRLGWAPKHFGQDDDFEARYKIDIFDNLSSIIIRDCMWSSFSASHRREKAAAAPAKPPPIPTAMAASRVPNLPLDAPSACAPARECVDPTAVLNIPVGGPKRPTSSGSESRTESSDDGEDDDEIDVVTVESRPSQRGKGARVPVTITVTGDPHTPGTKRFHVAVHRQQHNYAAPSPDTDHDDDDEEEEEEDDDIEELHSSKRARLDQSCPSSSCSSSSSPSSPHSSDSEDVSMGDRRRNHNFMERKRRNDLRSRFLALRDQIPDLADSCKTPKVAILTRATEYLLQLRAHERAQTQERKRLRVRHQQLLRRISNLKSS
uniref:BHLH domain-containing protein n=2 Tax=Denticeps clupeoides TaxID=299321 RepID=A0AAY3ZTT1_9TELE